MIYKLSEYVYLIKDKYTFKKQTFLDNNLEVHCFVAVSGDTVHCLIQSLRSPTKDEKDRAIHNYLKIKKTQNNKDYLRLKNNAKEIVEITGYKVGV